MNRSFTAEEWVNLIPKKAWYDAMDEANDVIDRKVQVDIQGYDLNPEAVKAARQNAKDAGVDHLIHFQERAVKDLSHPKKYGCNFFHNGFISGFKLLFFQTLSCIHHNSDVIASYQNAYDIRSF